MAKTLKSSPRALWRPTVVAGSLLISLLNCGSVIAPAEAAPEPECRQIGDTITVAGMAQKEINAGTYLEVRDAFCVNFPRKTDTYSVTNLTTIRGPLPPGIYLEITGRLTDLYPNAVGIGIDVMTVKNVDRDIKERIAQDKANCERWQSEAATGLRDKLHGNDVNMMPQSRLSNDFVHLCGMWGVDKDAPHDSITVMRPPAIQ